MISDYKLLSLYKLKHLTRYNSRPKIESETVAEHSFYVSLFALMTARELGLSDEQIEKILIKSILHDLPEMELNDITHDVKVKLGLYDFLKEYENKYYEENFNAEYELMKNDEDNIINAVVHFADILSVKQYCLQEMKLGNNSYEIKKIYNSTLLRLEKCQKLIEELTGKSL